MKKSILIAASLVLMSSAFAQERPYVIDQRNEVVMSGSGLCVRTGFWTPTLAALDPAGCKCDKDLLAAEVCAPKVVAVVVVPATAVKPAIQKITIAANTLFAFNKAVLSEAGKAQLTEVVTNAKALNLEVVLVTGYTDRIGSGNYNLALSEKRATAVKAFLINSGITADRVYAAGRGKLDPVTKDTCVGTVKTQALIDCLQPDRRVDLEVIGSK